MKIIVTGGAGYIGAITTHHLLQLGHDVVVVDDLSHGQQTSVPKERLRILRIQETDALTEVLKGADAVIHFAGFIAVGESVREPELYFSNNVGGTLSLFEAMNRAGVKKIVFSSTAAVYGDPATVPIREDSLIAPLNPYGESKVIVERILGELDRHRGVRSVCLRYFNACGAEPDAGLGELHDPETHLIPLLFRAIDTGTPVQIFGNDYPTPDGTCTRDYIHVADLAKAHISALEYLSEKETSNIFNVGTGTGNTVMEVIQAVEKITGRKVPYTMSARRAGDSASLVANSDKLQQTLGWKPTRSNLSEIIRDAWEFYQMRSSKKGAA